MQFQDINGNVWDVVITVATVKDVQRLLNVNLLQPKEVMPRLADPMFACDLAYCVCRKQAESLGISDEMFGASLGGNSLHRATQAVIDAYVDFFPNPDVRESVRALGEKMAELNKRMVLGINKRIKSMDQELERTVAVFEKNIDREIAKGLAEIESELND